MTIYCPDRLVMQLNILIIANNKSGLFRMDGHCNISTWWKTEMQNNNRKRENILYTYIEIHEATIKLLVKPFIHFELRRITTFRAFISAFYMVHVQKL